MTQLDALLAFVVAFAVTALVTPPTARLAVRVGAVDAPRERGLSSGGTPLLGGLAIFVGAATAGLIWLPSEGVWHGILAAAALITVVGAADDRWDLPARLKLAGQVAAAIIVVRSGVVVDNATLPFIGAVQFHGWGETLTVLGMVAIMNIVNFSDGVDGLAAGLCGIVAIAFAIIAFDLPHRGSAGVLAALTAGAALGFLVHNFHPASVFMGDAGSNLLGLLMGCVTVEASVKTQVVVSLVIPLALLAVPFLDTTFVILKRLKYRKPLYAADSEHFHHRLARIGFSQRKTVALLYAWTLMLAGFALALRFVPYSDDHGHFKPVGTIVMALLALFVTAASVYLVYVLEILKFRRLNAMRLRLSRPETTEAEVDADVERRLETGEFPALEPLIEPDQASRP
jgi:UDP-GlcNAc:undecaprenyl-phosphate/decaprenyl-phosphate GlcNAc-1-phosphate transferase